jgi:DNA repair protein RecN (Recombination protein N)
LIRAGAEELRVTGRFELDTPAVRAEVETILESSLEEDAVILSRRLNRTGRSQAYVNDQPVAVGTLRQIGGLLVDIHGQRESQSLLEPAYQLSLLDAYGHLEGPRQRYLDLAKQVRELRKRHQTLAAERQQRQRELALLRFERDELDEAALEPDEGNLLRQERERLVNAQDLQAFAARGYAQLYEDDGSIVEQLSKLHREAEGWVRVDPQLEEVVRRLEDLHAGIADTARALRDFDERWEADPARLDETERRLLFLQRLEQKYARPADDLILYRVALDEKEQRLQQQEDDLDAVRAELTAAFVKLKESAAELSKARKKVAKKLATETQKQLADLGMPDARLEAALEQIALSEDESAEVPAWGIDQLELMLAANPGEPSRPLRKVASGGELSRTMLALKSVLAGHDHTGTLIFDEVDSNVGGRLGDVLGQKLAALGKTHQVICVTHLPQVASYARHHWTIHKKKRGGRTVTTIDALAEADRLEELASMLRGESRGETTRKEVAAMLEAARKTRDG